MVAVPFREVSGGTQSESRSTPSTVTRGFAMAAAAEDANGMQSPLPLHRQHAWRLEREDNPKKPNTNIELETTARSSS